MFLVISRINYNPFDKLFFFFKFSYGLKTNHDNNIQILNFYQIYPGLKCLLCNLNGFDNNISSSSPKLEMHIF